MRRGRPLIPRQIALILRAQYDMATKPFTPLTVPYSTPVEAYQRIVRTEIPSSDSRGTAIVSASGSATVSVGPSGLGKIWYPQLASLATTTGANDNSTCSIYVAAWGQIITPQTQINGQSYSAGGDSVGLAVPPLHPGQCITAVWSGGTAGDTASLTLYGDQDALTI